MSKIIKPILLDETGKEIVAVLRQQNAFISALARNSVNALASSWKDIHNIVREGLAAEIFNIGDQLIVPWKDVAADKTYEVPLDIVNFGNVTLKDGSVVPAMFLQWHYCLPFAVQFDHAENEQATESTFLNEYCYYEAVGVANDQYRLLIKGTDYTVGNPIPSSKTYYHTAIKDPTGQIVAYGYNRWSNSAVRQFLNSAKGVNEWWTPQHLGDVAPEELATKAGFMSGFDEEFLSCLKPIKVTTALNAVTDTQIGIPEDTYDTFFLPSLEQIYAQPEIAGVEGTFFEYWKQAVGENSPVEWYVDVPAYITYAIDEKTSAQFARLRSALRTNSVSTWNLSKTGYVSDNFARYTFRFAPVCAIC